jgi:hypothetical protein
MYKRVFLIFLFPTLVFSAWSQTDLGRLSGHWDFSVGTHFWTDHIVFRNAQLQNTTYIQPGLRANALLRSNREFEGISIIEPYVDELYLEKFGGWKNGPRKFNFSLKAGQTRYLRYPAPDIISMYDQVPGTEDLRFGEFTAYKGLIFANEFMYKHVGVHYTGVLWIDSPYKNITHIQDYLFYRPQFKRLDIEARAGKLAHRIHPLGDSSNGYSLHIGWKMKGYRAGVLYEYIEGEGIRTGVLVEFAQSAITNFLGKYRADFTRSPMGIGFQPTLLKGMYGFKKTPPKGAIKVGEVIARRTITYWQNGQGRNFYEHIISETGDTTVAKNTVIVLEEKPRYLRIESLVSLHNKFQTWSDFEDWEAKRQGPAELSQTIFYSYYKLGN